MLFFIVIDNTPCKIYDSQTFPMLKKKKSLVIVIIVIPGPMPYSGPFHSHSLKADFENSHSDWLAKVKFPNC